MTFKVPHNQKRKTNKVHCKTGYVFLLILTVFRLYGMHCKTACTPKLSTNTFRWKSNIVRFIYSYNFFLLRQFNEYRLFLVFIRETNLMQAYEYIGVNALYFDFNDYVTNLYTV